MAGGLESVSGVMEAADPTSDMPALQQVKTNLGQAAAGLRTDTALTNPNDIMNNVIIGADRDAQDMLQYKQSMLQAQQAQQEQQAKYMEYLQSLKNPERENWDAIGKMGAAMAQPNTSVYGNQFASGLQALQGATEDRNTRYDLIDKTIQQQELSQADQIAANAGGNYKDARLAYNDKLKSIIDYQKAYNGAGGKGDPGEIGKLMNLLEKYKNEPEKVDYIKSLIQAKFYGQTGKDMALLNPNVKFGTPEFSKMAAIIKTGGIEALKLKEKFEEANRDDAVAYARENGLDPREVLDGMWNNVLQKVRSEGISGAPEEVVPTSEQPKPTQVPTPKPTSPAPANGKVDKLAVYQNEIDELIKFRNTLTDPTDIQTANQNIVMIKEEMAKLGGKPQVTNPSTRGVPMQTSADKKGNEKRATDIAEAEAKAVVQLPTVIASAQDSLSTLNDLKSHPGREWGLGWKSNVKPENWNGTDAQAFKAIVDQLQGAAFLTAFNQLRGGGQITVIEGDKATQALNRIKYGMNPEEFDKNITLYINTLKKGVERAKAATNLKTAADVVEDAGAANPIKESTLPRGVPEGSKLIGTSKGKNVYQAPDGKKYIHN